MSEIENVVNLFEAPSRIKEVMAGPWEDISVDRVEGAPVALVSDDVEHAGFVLSGVLTAANASGEVFTLRKGSAFAVPQGGRLELSSAAAATFLHIVLNVH